MAGLELQTNNLPHNNARQLISFAIDGGTDDMDVAALGESTHVIDLQATLNG